MKLSSKPEIHLLILDGLPILEQLRLEEALLRADQRNWCLINQNLLEAIVMGISARPHEVIDLEKWKLQPIPVIRRFSGGGTVFLDKNCLMKTFIFNQSDINVPCFPQPIFQWSETIYQPIFEGIAFSLKENDYVIGERKCGGNAQCITKNRWLHHTSFLWDYHREKMSYLKMPPKMPQYRNQREHQDFLCGLKDHFSHPQEFLNKFLQRLNELFVVKKVDQDEVQSILQRPHRKTSDMIDIEKGC